MKSSTFLFIFLTAVWLNVDAQSRLKNEDKLLDSLLKRKHACQLSGEKISLDDFIDVRDATFGFNFCYPKNFQEIINKNFVSLYDTTKYESLDRNCTLKIWPGKTINFPLGAIDKHGKSIKLKSSDIIRAEKFVEKYTDSLITGKIEFIGNLKITELCTGINGYEFQIALNGIIGDYGCIYKVYVSELPVSGDLIFKHLLYLYKLEFKNKYEPIGLAIANDFGTRKRKKLE